MQSEKKLTYEESLSALAELKAQEGDKDLPAIDIPQRQRTQKGIKPYDNMDVFLTYQNNGSTWVGILRGKNEDIELVFNGLFNFKATNGELYYHNCDKNLATFWTNAAKMDTFFFLKEFFHRCNAGLDKGKRGGSMYASEEFAQKSMEALRTNGHEVFFNFDNQFSPEYHAMGSIRAERPDSDFKSAVLEHAFAAPE